MERVRRSCLEMFTAWLHSELFFIHRNLYLVVSKTFDVINLISDPSITQIQIPKNFICDCNNFSNLFKRFFLPIFIGSAASIGGLFCFLMPPHLLKVEGQGLYNMYVEFLIRRSRSTAVILLRESTAAATLMFSILHTCVMYGFVKKSSSNFWFSSFKLNTEAKSKCDQVHGSLSCSEYLKKVKQSNKLQNQTMPMNLLLR